MSRFLGTKLDWSICLCFCDLVSHDEITAGFAVGPLSSDDVLTDTTGSLGLKQMSEKKDFMVLESDSGIGYITHR